MGNTVFKVSKALKVRNCFMLFRLFTLGTLYFIHFPLCSAQQGKVDSLCAVLKTEKDDTNKVNTLNLLSLTFDKRENYDTSLIYATHALALAQKLGFKKGMGTAFRNIGVGYMDKGMYTQAMDYALKAITLEKEIGDKKGLSASLNSAGTICEYMSNYPKALEYYSQALAISREIKDKNGEGINLGNMGNIYHDEGNYPKSLEYDLQSLTIAKEMGNKERIAANLGNIGLTYYNQGEFSKALKFDIDAYSMDSLLEDKDGMAINMGNIGNVYYNKNNFSKALEYDLKALAIYEAIGEKDGIALNLGNIGSIYNSWGILASQRNNSVSADSLWKKALEYDYKALNLEKTIEDIRLISYCYSDIGSIYCREKKMPLAKAYIDSSINLAKSIGEKDAILSTTEVLYFYDSAAGNYKMALEDYKKYIACRDSLVNEANTKKTVQEEMNYEFDQKQAAEKAEQDKKDAVTEADKRKQNIVIAFVSLGLILVIVFAFILFNRFRITQRQKKIIEEQKALVDEKNKDITDSIHYASRIQRALLTTDGYISKRVPEHFILFKPRDIVSGDFYWANEIGNRFLICAGDCTGHGVPGAFMSLLNISMLNETTIEKKIHSPAHILDDVREHIIKALNPEGTDGGSKDGMDCVLCSFDFANHTLEFACANNPLWIVRNNECIEFKADKMPVGVQSETHIPFTLQTTPLQKGDMVYMFTDGYADQFGGPKGKKFKYKQLQEKLLAISHRPLAEQRNALEQKLEEWKGDLAQIDDVLIIGIRV
jgi:serine phosphatase RsbU (regulator of sigma subunit)/tetratricopeptide (TPR) repeat protein